MGQRTRNGRRAHEVPLSVRTAAGSAGAALEIPYTPPAHMLAAPRDSLTMVLLGEACTHCAYGDDPGFSSLRFFLRHMLTVLNMCLYRIPRLVGGKRRVHLRESQSGGAA